MARNLQVVLTEDLPNVGNSGEVVKVRPGFARNFLIPRGLAAIATKSNLKAIEHAKRVAAARAIKMRAGYEAIASKLADVKLTITAQVGDGEKLYGAITTRDVEVALAQQGFEIDRRKIQLDPIKELGSYKAAIRVGTGVDANVDVEIVAKS